MNLEFTDKKYLFPSCILFFFVQKLSMEIKCKTYPKYTFRHRHWSEVNFGRSKDKLKQSSVCVCEINEGVCVNKDKFEKKSVENANSAGFLSFRANRFDRYCKNINHTFEHKVIYAKIEKELFGKCSINSITHDLDKMILYLFGFSYKFVSKFHRKHSEHHFESGKNMNLKSMLCDNIASSPVFKPEKKYNLRDFYKISNELKQVKGFGDLLEEYNYGESLDYDKIKSSSNKINNIKKIAEVLTTPIALIFNAFTIN